MKLSRSSKNHATCGVSMRIPKGDVDVLSRRWHFHGVFQGRGGVCVKIIRSRYPRGTRSMQATYLYVYTGPLVYIAAIVHGEQPLSTRARIPANIDPVVARDGSNGNSISLPPSAHRNLCFLRNPRPSSHHS